MISSNSLLTALNKYIILLCNFILVLYSTRLWGSEGRGFIALVITNISIVNILTNVTSGSPLAYYASKKNRRFLMLVNIAGGFVLSMLGSTVVCFFLGWGNFEKYFAISLLIALANSFATYFLGKGNILYYNILTILNPLITVICITTAIILQFQISLDYYFYSMAFGLFVSILLGSWFYSKEKVENGIKEIFYKDFLEIISYGFKNELSYLFQFLCFRVSFFFMAELQGISTLGVFSVAVAIVESIWVVSRSLATVHYAEILANTNSSDSNIKATQVRAFQSLFISLVISLAIIIIPAELYAWIFGKDFTQIKVILLYLLPGCLVISFSDLYGYYFAAIGKQYVLIKKSLIGFGFVILSLGVGTYCFEITTFTICIVIDFCCFLQSIYLLYNFKRIAYPNK